ncbi:peptidase [Gardnerella pickettii]|uniref:peptidase n=1 Tax=Gardnerella pickettii TaxID=2914924 RepID=UPI0039EFF67A
MMNKKAIAAFAAGATLLAGFAMATPAFAADAAKTPDQILTEDTAALAKKDTAIEAQKKTVEEKQKAVEEKQKAVDAAKLLYGQEYKEDTAGKGKEQADALKEAQTALTTEQTKLDNMYNKAYYDLKEKVAQEKADKEARDDAAYKAAHSKAHHVAVVSAAKSKLDSAAAGQAGANGAAAGAKTTVVEKKKDGGKKLPGTGVGVTLTALAATMLAGMGAAVRKARH